MCMISTGIMMAVSLAISAITAGVTYMEQSAAAQNQYDYQMAQQRAHNEATVRNAEEAIKEQGEQSAAERIRQMQQQSVAANDIQRYQREAMMKQGNAMASSQASGTALDMLMADYERAYAINKDAANQQLEMQGVSADTNIRAYRDQAAGRISAQKGYIPQAISQPSLLAAGLGFAGDAFNMYNTATDYGKDSLFSSGGTIVSGSKKYNSGLKKY